MKIPQQLFKYFNGNFFSLYLIFSLLFVILVIYATSGPRGSDQFWYLTDVETLLSGKPPLTNTIFPGPFIRENIPVEKSYFIHHTPMLYMVIPFAKYFGAYRGWIILNILAAMAAALCIAYTVLQLSNASLAAFTYCTFLLMPVIFWQTANVLQEIMFAFIMALVLMFFMLSEISKAARVSFVIVAGLGVFFHPIFMGVGCAGILYNCLSIISNKRRIAANAGFFIFGIAILAGTKAIQPSLFPSGFQPNIKAIIMDSIPGKQMAWHLSIEPPSISLSVYGQKIAAAIKNQFGLSFKSIFFWPQNFMIASLLFIASPRQHWGKRRILLIFISILLLFCGMVILHQNQFRYQVFILPIVIVGSAYKIDRFLMHRFDRHVTVGVFSIFIIGIILIDVSLAMRLRSDGIKYQRIGQTAKKILNRYVDPDDRTIISFQENPLFFAYLLSPRKSLLLSEKNLAKNQIGIINNGFGARWLICDTDSNLPSVFNIERNNDDYKEFKALDLKHGLYKIDSLWTNKN